MRGQSSGARVVPLNIETAKQLGGGARGEHLHLYTGNSATGPNMLNGGAVVIESSSIKHKENLPKNLVIVRRP